MSVSGEYIFHDPVECVQWSHMCKSVSSAFYLRYGRDCTEPSFWTLQHGLCCWRTNSPSVISVWFSLRSFGAWRSMSLLKNTRKVLLHFLQFISLLLHSVGTAVKGSILLQWWSEWILCYRTPAVQFPLVTQSDLGHQIQWTFVPAFKCGTVISKYCWRY